MGPRPDGIILGGTNEHSEWSLDPSPIETSRILHGTDDFRVDALMSCPTALDDQRILPTRGRHCRAARYARRRPSVSSHPPTISPRALMPNATVDREAGG